MGDRPAVPPRIVATRPIGCVECAKPCALVGDEVPSDALCPWCRAERAPKVFGLFAMERAGAVARVGVVTPRTGVIGAEPPRDLPDQPAPPLGPIVVPVGATFLCGGRTVRVTAEGEGLGFWIDARPGHPRADGEFQLSIPPRANPREVTSDDSGTLSIDADGFRTIRACSECGVLVAGGPTRCKSCTGLRPITSLRGTTEHPCEGCQQTTRGNTLRNGWYRCNACGYPGQ